MKQYLLIDIGGTFIKYSLADEQARKISGGKVPTPLTNMDDLLAPSRALPLPFRDSSWAAPSLCRAASIPETASPIPVECSVPLCGSSPLLRR